MKFRFGVNEVPIHLHESLLDVQRHLERRSAGRTVGLIVLGLLYTCSVFFTRSELVAIWGGVILLALLHTGGEGDRDARFALGIRSLFELDRNQRHSFESVEGAIRAVRSLDT